MQQTFEINTGQLNQIVDAVIATFGHRKVKVMIEDVQPEIPVDQKEVAKKVLALRERFKHVKVDPNVDLSGLANEMLGE